MARKNATPWDRLSQTESRWRQRSVPAVENLAKTTGWTEASMCNAEEQAATRRPQARAGRGGAARMYPGSSSCSAFALSKRSVVCSRAALIACRILAKSAWTVLYVQQNKFLVHSTLSCGCSGCCSFLHTWVSVCCVAAHWYAPSEIHTGRAHSPLSFLLFGSFPRSCGFCIPPCPYAMRVGYTTPPDTTLLRAFGALAHVIRMWYSRETYATYVQFSRRTTAVFELSDQPTR